MFMGYRWWLIIMVALVIASVVYFRRETSRSWLSFFTFGLLG